ncbi:MAG: patatin family protein [Alphaproteobacteria bacterium]|nr:patatin family protein [Alphaproteobacteria bacterium]
MSSCLVLEGGAKRGIYTAGVLDVFLENGIMTDGVIGVSAGAIHGCSYVSKQIGRSIRYNLKYNDDYRFMSFKSFLKTGNVVDTNFAYYELPEKLDLFDHKTFEENNTKFYATCTNINTGKAEYILCPNLRQHYINYLRASASMPLVSQIVKLDNNCYLDGGISDSIPLKAAFDLGFDKNIVVLTRPKGYVKKPFSLLWLVKLVYRKFPNFINTIKNRHKVYNQTIEYIEQLEDKKQIFVIRPSKLIKIGRMETNVEIIKQMYELGRQDALKVIDDVKNFLA